MRAALHQRLDALQSRSFKREHPLVVAQRERLDGVRTHVRKVARRHAVLGEDPAALLRIHYIPVIGAHERVHRDPVPRLLSHDETGQVGFVELGRAVQAVAYPAQLDALSKGSLPPEVCERFLQVFKLLRVPPNHEVRVGPDTGVVVDATNCDQALLLQAGEEGASLVDNLRPLTSQRTRDCAEHSELQVALCRVEFVEIKLGHGFCPFPATRQIKLKT